MIKRNITERIVEALSDNPVVFLSGARQTGKSTLVQSLARSEHPARYITFDDATALSAASSDPAGYLSGTKGPVVLDEVQRVPGLFMAIKAEVDRSRDAGRFLLTGSADVLLLPGLSESLAGRMEILTLWPFSQGEITSVKERFVDAVFGRDIPQDMATSADREDLHSRILTGGFPEMLARKSAARQKAWFDSYITAILQRDVREIAQIERLTELPRLLSLLAARATSLVNYSEISRSMGMPLTTLRRYMALLEMTFLVRHLSPWSTNLGKRLVRSHKINICDCGLMAHLMGVLGKKDLTAADNPGALLENFVVMELRKQSTWSETQPRMYFYRTQAGREVDIILEDASGNIVGIEVKSSATVGKGDFRSLQALAELLGKAFLKGIVLYTGHEIVPFGAKLFALPVSLLYY